MADEVCERAVAALVERGPLDEDDLLEVSGFWDDDEAGDVDGLMFHLYEEHRVWQTHGPCFLPEHVLDGRTFTHRLTVDERATGSLRVGPDLLVAALAGDRDAVGAPPDMLEPYAAGDLLGVSWIGGVVEARLVDAPVPGREAELLRDAFETSVDRTGVAELFDVVTSAALADGDAFRAPRRPISELLADAELEERGDWVAEAGFDWTARVARLREEGIVRLMREHGLDRPRATLLQRLEAATHDAEGDVDEAFADAEVVDVFVCDQLVHPILQSTIDGAGALAADVLARPDPPAGAHLVAARVAEHRDDAAAFVAGIDAAMDIDPSFAPAFDDAAYLASLRGDASAAVDLLRRSGASRSDERLVALRRYTEPPPGVSRNAPCPCGSGRKTKACCLGTMRHPLPARIEWLVGKVDAFMDRPPQRTRLVDFVSDLLGLDGPEDDRTAVALGRAHPETWTFAAFDGGGLDRFLDATAALLPGDEHAVAQGWRGVRHRLVRLDDVLPDTGVRLTDVRRGEQLQVSGRVDRSVWRTGGLAVALVLPVEGGWQLAGHPTVAVDAIERELREAAAFTDPLALGRVCVQWFVEIGRQLFGIDAEERLALAVPGVDPDEVGDLTDDDIELLVRADHPAMVDAVERGDDTLVIDGNEVNPRLHLALHVVAARRLLDDDPPGTWVHARSLLEAGHGRHAVLHRLMHDVSNEVYDALHRER